ncbi:TlpA disulfide reductase family protein [uncultured Duncaniella sp.]|uniref:TlpA family protein disulfide reductase n=1 Tax=uncultured Duncaniella sp. TaxID=2768039 RepID=UPI00262E364E|nr:TlpA disulfide reductase family protein [uncultured Duncaniella sp.]
MKLSVIISCAICAMGLLSASMPVSAQTYTLDVQFKNIPDSVRFTLGSNDDKYKQKVYTSDNRLRFDIDITEDYPVKFYLIGKNPDQPKTDRFFISFYAGKGINHRVTSYLDGFSTDSVTFAGAPWDAAHNQWTKFHNTNAKCTQHYSKLRQELFMSRPKTEDGYIEMDSVTQAKAKSLMAEIMRLQDEFFNGSKDFIMSHPDSPDALDLLGWRYPAFTQSELKEIASNVPVALKKSPENLRLEKLVSITRIVPGAKLSDYDIEGENADGSPIRLSQFTTPYILVDFNSLGCGACRAAARNELPGFLEKYGDRVTFVSDSVDEDRKSMLKAHELDKATWPTIWNGSGRTSDTSMKYGVTGYPTFFLFGPDRTLIDQWSGWGPGSIEAQFTSLTKTSDNNSQE